MDLLAALTTLVAWLGFGLGSLFLLLRTWKTAPFAVALPLIVILTIGFALLTAIVPFLRRGAAALVKNPYWMLGIGGGGGGSC
jgi:hypothetical protein